MPTSLARAILVGAALLGGACSGDESFRLFPVNAGRLDDRYLETCRVWAAAATAYSERCWGHPSAAGPFDRATIDCQILLANPNVGVGESDVRSCASFLPESTCSRPGQVVGLLSTSAALAACSLPMGKSPLGALCVLSAECESGRCAADATIADTPPFCGRCMKAVMKVEPCGEVCPSGTVCSPRDMKCHRPSHDGAPCLDAGDCESLFCPDGVCRPRAELGQACGLLLYDSAPLCQESLFCSSNWRCGRLVAVGDGEPCGEHGNDLWTCPSAASCAYWIDEPVCIPPVPDGAPCSSDQGLNCRKPAVCLGGICQYPHPSHCALSRF